MAEDPDPATDDATGDGPPEAAEADDLRENDPSRFDRLPATAADREVRGRATREAVLSWWDDRFGVDPSTFDDHTFWEKGAGKVWILAGDAPDPCDVETLGLTFLRTRQEHWKPTTDATQRFGGLAGRNVIDLDAGDARRFLAGEEWELDWDGDWGYVIAAHELAGGREPIGVGLYVYGELRSMVPKGRRREF